LSSIFKKILASHKNNLPFVSFRKPNSNKINTYLCEDSSIKYSESYKEEGFVFAPFHNHNPSIIFLKSKSKVYEDEFVNDSINSTSNSFHQPLYDQKRHLDLVISGIDAIKNNQFKKVVLSRKEIIKLDSIDILSIFQRLLCEYENAFVYVWFHPKIGLWMGATPERLVTLNKREFHTTALASTQVFKGNMNPFWGTKEKEEHQFVLDYIVSQIKNQENGIILKNFSVSDTYTIKAGNLLHLKADIKGTISDFELKSLLDTLHPTPAVCGLPKAAAKEFILQNENYDRCYYTGFLGEINTNLKTELFVNLRCVEIIDTCAVIYVGGGITLDSNPEDEWLETSNKTNTIKSVLK